MQGCVLEATINFLFVKIKKGAQLVYIKMKLCCPETPINDFIIDIDCV